MCVTSLKLLTNSLPVHTFYPFYFMAARRRKHTFFYLMYVYTHTHIFTSKQYQRIALAVNTYPLILLQLQTPLQKLSRIFSTCVLPQLRLHKSCYCTSIYVFSHICLNTSELCRNCVHTYFYIQEYICIHTLEKLSVYSSKSGLVGITLHMVQWIINSDNTSRKSVICDQLVSTPLSLTR